MENNKSLYRKYRPKNLDEVSGHKNIKEILISEIRSKKFSHAMLFAGQKGTGKTSIAKIFAKIINCSNLKDYNPCNECDNCNELNKFSHPDVFEIDAASNNGVEEIRNLKAGISTLPILSKYKVYIIDEAHMLTNAAFNAFLKTLEEPPRHIVFILATTEFSKIPATITSRCQVFNFKRIPQRDLENKVKEICHKEGKTITEEALREIYYMSEGSLRDALNYLEQTMVIINNQVTIEEIKKVFYIASKKDKIEIIENVFNGNNEKIIIFFEEANDQGIDFQSTTLGMINIIKDIILYKMTKNLNNIKILNENELNKFNNITVDNFFLLANNLSDAYTKSKNSNVNYQYILINILKTINDINPLISVYKNIQPVVAESINSESESIPTNENLLFDQEFVEDNQAEMQPQTWTLSNANNAENSDQIINIIDEKKLAEQKIIELTNDMQDIKFNYNIKNDQILEVIALATKEDRILTEQKIKNLLEPIDKNLYNTLLPFVQVKIKAANQYCAILVSEDAESSDWLNWKLQNEKYRTEIYTLLGFKKIFICIDKNKWKNIKNEFLFKKSANQLPNNPTIIDDVEYFKSIILTDDKDDFTKKVISIFGDDVKVVD